MPLTKFRDGLEVHSGNGMVVVGDGLRDQEDDRMHEPEPYSPSREAMELAAEIIEYMLQYPSISAAIEPWSENVRAKFTLGLFKVYDKWSNE